MFLTLLAVTLGVAFATAAVIARVFRDPVDRILSRIIADDISSAWLKYMTFAIYSPESPAACASGTWRST